MIYFDNSASSFVKPKSVIKAVQRSLMEFTANPGRSGHKFAIKTAMEVEKVRQACAKHLNTTADKIIFTLNCTDALNMAILGTAQKNGHVVCTENEHNSVLRPLNFLHMQGVTFTIAKQSGKRIVWSDIEKCLTEKTYLVVVNHVSNINGDVADIEDIGNHLKEKGILFLVDAAQGGGHFIYDMQKMNINMLSLAPHKGFYSPQGIGVLAINGDFSISPVRFGGTGINSLELEMPSSFPERLESGTLNTPAILGFGEGLKFVEENFCAIKEKLEDLTTYLHYELSKLPEIKIYTKTENSNGVFAFNVIGLNSAEVANYLNEKWDICVRSGYHCAPEKHKALDTLESGTVRVSFCFFNTYQEVERLVFAVKTLIKKNK